MSTKVRDLDVVLGSNIKAIRKLKGLTQKDIADQLGITFQQVQKYEKGDNRVSTTTLIRLSNLMDVHPMMLLDGLYEESKKENTVSLHSLSKESLDLIRMYSEIQDPEIKGAIKGFLGSVAKRKIDEKS